MMAKHHAISSSGHIRILLGAVLWLGCLLSQISTDFEVCNPGMSDIVFQFRAQDCPYGVMFEHPITAYCMNSTSGPESFFTDLCDNDNYNFNVNDVPYKIQLAFGQDTEPIDPDSSCAGEGPGKCNSTKIVIGDTATLTEPDRADPCDFDMFETVLTQEEEDRREDAQVFNQTERMFKFIVGLHKDDNPEGPNFRLVKLLRQSFKILEAYCDISFVPLKFGEDVLSAFLFLLRDSDLSNFKDVSVEDFNNVLATLAQCERMPREPFRLIGKKCKTCSSVYSIEKDGHSIRHAESELSFMWGRHDLPVDATWGTLSFVHGLCYGTFRLNVNYHHIFQRATEQLFTPEILYRWKRPPLLYYEEIWDNMFSAPVRATMRNLDMCISAAYYKTPFLHRLERPIEAPVIVGNRRKKRSLSTITLDVAGLAGAGWCFQNKEDLLATSKAYVNLHCPDVKKPWEELEDTFKTKNYVDFEGFDYSQPLESKGGAIATVVMGDDNVYEMITP